jgi:hypothetical protein
MNKTHRFLNPSVPEYALVIDLRPFLFSSIIGFLRHEMVSESASITPTAPPQSPPVNQHRCAMAPTVDKDAHQSVKYRCPACLRQLCSLDCYQRHCLEFTCAGKRDQARTMVARADIDAAVVRRDYCFLESISRRLSERASSLSPSQSSPPLIQSIGNAKMRMTSSKDASAKMSENQRKMLERACKWRRIKWLQLPAGMSKRQQNASSFDKKYIISSKNVV